MPGGTSPSLYFWGDLPDLGAPLVEVILDEGELSTIGQGAACSE